MQLPNNEYLNTHSLSRLFNNMSESYKIFWFKAIVEHVSKGETELSFDVLINSMIKNAWYMVSEYRLNLGPSDTLEKTVKHIQEISNIKSAAKDSEILAFVENCEDKSVKEFKRVLTLNVPYRLQAPFMPEITNRIWKSSVSAIQYINMQRDVIYGFDDGKGLDKKVLVKKPWADYIQANAGILLGWIDCNLITYLQKRNPSVPGIANKIYPPQERKLEAAKAYWKAVITAKAIPNIYTNDVMTIKDISVDHFVPWSYVAHDELWNLVPTTRSINSSKSNNLPKWDVYFPRLCGVEYAAYELVQEYDHMKDLHKIVTKCMKEHLNDEDIRYRLYQSNQTKEHFGNQLKEIILPAYESAKKMGFGEWVI